MHVRRLITSAVLLLSLGCAARHGAPVFDAGSKPLGIGGTISGTVRAAGGEALAGRTVTVIDTKSGATFRVSTAPSGGYTIQVPAARYRLEAELRPGETLSRQPEPTQINVGDLDAQRDFVVSLR